MSHSLLSSTVTGVPHTPLNLTQLILEQVTSSVFLVMPFSEELRIDIQNKSLLRATEYLTPVLNKYELSQLMYVAVDEKPYKPQSLYGSLLVGWWDSTGEFFFIIHGGIPGPFPSVSSHPDGDVYLADTSEALVWIVAHEFCHFLKRSYQIDGPNDEKSACEFADFHLEQFRAFR